MGLVIAVAAAKTGEGLQDLTGAILRDVRAAEQDEAAQPQAVAVVAPRDDGDSDIRVTRASGGDRVYGQKAIEAVAKLGLETEEARAEVARRLRRMGVAAALRRAGARAGDRVRIG